MTSKKISEIVTIRCITVQPIKFNKELCNNYYFPQVKNNKIDKSFGLDTEEFLPEKIRDEYDFDYNILNVDKIIRRKILNEKTVNIPLLQERKAALNKLVRKPQNISDRQKTINEIQKIDISIKQIETEEKLIKYNDEVHNILTYYRNYKKSILSIDFDNTKRIYTEEDIKFSNAIDLYLKIAAKYIDIIVTKKNGDEKTHCENCAMVIEEDFMAESEDGIKICENCQCENILMSKNKPENKNTHTNRDEGLENFLFAFDCYRGVKYEPLSETFIKKLNAYFSGKGALIGEQVKLLPLNKKGRRGNTNPKMLWEALSKIGYSRYYKYTNYIAHKYWGWKLPDVDKYRNVIIDIYNKTQNGYYKIPNEEKERKSNLGIQFRLFKTLELAGHECWKDEFRIPENEKSENISVNLWRRMCNGAEDEKIYFKG